MSQYDIAAGVSLDAANQLLGNLYALPKMRNGLFKGTVTKTIDVVGTVTVTYDVKAQPTLLLQPPSAAQWTASQRKDPKQTTPPANTIQIVLSDLAGTAAVGGSKPLPAEGPVTIYASVKETSGNVKISVVALLIDETNFSAWDKLIVNQILIPQLFKLADELIPAIVLPQLPQFAGMSFQPLVVSVTATGIVVGSTLTGGSTTDLSGFLFPPQPIFVLSKLTPINQFLKAEVKGPYKAEDSSGPSGWKATGRITATNLTVTASIVNSTPTINVKGSFSAYGELSGAGVGVTKALLCPIGAAADAIADPSNWDKVISSFDIQYKPDPMPVPVNFTAQAPAGTPLAQAIQAKVPSDKLPSSIQIIFAPTWSGSVTGSTLAAAAAAFIDLISVIFGKLIIQSLVEKYATASYSLPLSEMTQSISLPGGSVTVSLAAVTGSQLQCFGSDQLLQPLQITLS